jgi:hypothetical protein
MSKRIHELVKDWDVAAKDMMTAVERAGIRGKKSQSTLSDEEIVRVREALGLAPRPTVTVGAERVVAERVVTERDALGDHLVGTRADDRDTAPRQRIRRRTAREVVKREDLPPPVPGEGAAEVPPPFAAEDDIPPPLGEVPPSLVPEAPHAPARPEPTQEAAAAPAIPEPAPPAAPTPAAAPPAARQAPCPRLHRASPRRRPPPQAAYPPGRVHRRRPVSARCERSRCSGRSTSGSPRCRPRHRLRARASPRRARRRARRRRARRRAGRSSRSPTWTTWRGTSCAAGSGRRSGGRSPARS